MTIQTLDAESQLLKHLVAFILSVGIPLVLRLITELKLREKITAIDIIMNFCASFGVCYFVHVVIILSEWGLAQKLYHFILALFSYISSDLIISLYNKRKRIADELVEKGVDKIKKL